MRRRAIAIHEATHAVVAMEVGLPVAWVSIDHGSDEGIDFTAAVKIPDELIDRERDLFEICVAMSAPSHYPTGDEDVDRYAAMEADLAYTVAGREGIPPAEVYRKAKEVVAGQWHEIEDLALQLVERGRVTYELVA